MATDHTAPLGNPLGAMDTDNQMELTVDTGMSVDTAGMSTRDTSTTPIPLPSGLTKTATSSVQQLQKRRSSTRSIKRKKFDDELVESSLNKTERTRIRIPSISSSQCQVAPLTPVGVTPITPAPQTPVSTSIPVVIPPPGLPPIPTTTLVTPEVPCVESTAEDTVKATAATSTTAPAPSAAPSDSSKPLSAAPITPATPSTPVTVSAPIDLVPNIIPTPVAPPEKKKPKSSSKRTKKSKPPPAGSTKDLGRWKPQDDLALINAVQQTCDLSAVFHGIKFSCKFTLKEIQERWYALMYDNVLSKLSIQAIKQLHLDVISEVNSQALYNKEEENLLKKISSTSQPNVEIFQELLSKSPAVFHPGRTAKVLHNHWLLMKQYHLLPDQSVPPMPKGDHVLNFSDAEDMINEEELRDPKDEALEHELSVADRRQKREIRHVEQELPKWQVLVDSVVGISPPDFDNQTLAVLRGRLVRYLMRSREITLGRATKDNQIDVDLSLEGPAWKISRRQGMIKLKNNGDFYIANEGKRPLYIDGKAVLMGNKQKLNNNSVVEISCLRFIFLINQDLISVIRQESQKGAA